MHRLRRLLGSAALLLAVAAAGLAPTAGWSQNNPASKQRPGTTQPAPTSYAQHAAAQRFAAELDQQQGWSDGWAQHWIAQAQRNPQALRLIAPPPTGTLRNWNAYRARFIEPTRLQAGLRFWHSHEHALQRAEATFGVPAWLIVGIIGVETLYGQHMGDFRVLDALSSLAFDFPQRHPRAEQRTAFFRGELAAFLALARRQGIAPDAWRGSFAGALGWPQFMPSNWDRFGVDFDGDGRIDLMNSPTDAIGSVARYLRDFGWQTGMPTHFALQLDPARVQLDTLLAPSIVPTFSAAAMQALGVVLPEAAQAHPGLLALVELENGDPARGGAPRSYVAGTQNFFVITRYNQSSYYALAVIDLGQAVQSLRNHPSTHTPPPPAR